MGIVDLAFMQGYIRMATDGVNMGWHERNGGNLTYRLTKEEVEQARPYFSDGKPWVEIGVDVKNLAGEYFLATGTGKFLRNVQLEIPGCLGTGKGRRADLGVPVAPDEPLGQV